MERHLEISSVGVKVTQENDLPDRLKLNDASIKI